MKGARKRVVLAAGGTGGHIFPAQALARALSSQGVEVFLFTDGRGAHFQGSPGEVLTIPARHIQGHVAKRLRGLITLVWGIGVALYQVWRLKPQVVVGFGGYSSFPTVVAACLLRYPTVIHQADAYFGRTNRLLAPFVRGIATSFPEVKNIPPSCYKKVSFTGLPVRSDIQPSPYVSFQAENPIFLLVTGGSQGAKVFGEVIPRAIALLSPSLQKRFVITQQCRKECLENVQELYSHTKAKVELSPFFTSMGEHYKKADLLIGRAGASSVVEAACAGRPALFVPYPHAMDDHQFYNAQQAVVCGGGWMMREHEFTPEAFANFLSDLITFPWKLKDAAVNIQKIGVLGASGKLARLVQSLES